MNMLVGPHITRLSVKRQNLIKTQERKKVAPLVVTRDSIIQNQ